MSDLTAFFDDDGFALALDDGLMVGEDCCCEEDCPCLACDVPCASGANVKQCLLSPSILMERNPGGDPCDGCAQINDTEWRLPYTRSVDAVVESEPDAEPQNVFRYVEHHCYWELVLPEDEELGACQVRSVRLEVFWNDNQINNFGFPVAGATLNFYATDDFSGVPIIVYTLNPASTEKLPCTHGITLTQSDPTSATCVSTAYPLTTATCALVFVAA
jgi:hypothetical protein